MHRCGDANNNAVSPEGLDSQLGSTRSDSDGGDAETDTMCPAQTFPKTHVSTTGLQRLLDGPYTNGAQDMVMKRHQARYHSHPTFGKQRLLVDSGDSEVKGDDSDVSSSLSRSKTMPSLGRPKLTRRLTGVADGERLRQAKEIVEKAIKYRKVFTIQGGYSVIRQSLRRRGWVEKFYRIPGPGKKTNKSKHKRTSDDDDSDDDDDDGGGATDGNDNTDGNDDDDDNDDDNDVDNDDGGDHPKIPPWEEDDGLYGIMSRMVRNVNPSFIWVLKRDVIDYRFLSKEQMVNHYCKAGSFTTKVGLCVNMKNVPWYDNADPDMFFPRCYRLSQEEDKAAFIDDYRLTACMNIIKIVVSQSMDGTVQPKETGEDTPTSPACTNPECTRSVPNSISGNKCAHTLKAEEDKPAEDKEEPKDSSDSSKPPSLTPRGKKPKKKVQVPLRVLEQAMYRCEQFLASKDHDDIDVHHDPMTLTDSQWDQLIQHYYHLAHDEGIMQPVAQNILGQCESLLNRLKTRWPQFEMDGTRNVWIVKPGAKSRGRGIICYDRIEDMLKLVNSQVVRKDSKFVVQKYIERPLLIYNTKFDIRQWFLVTDWNPLTIWFYQDSYLRFCSQQYTLDDFNEAIHLSNNAIQKHKKNGPRSNKLPSDNMWTHEDFQEYLKTRKQATAWEDIIYPGMKKALICALLVTQDIIEYRKASFELYGADFMLTEDCQPLLIEINSSPSMEASTPITARLCANVLEDTIKVAVDRKYDRNCDIGRFELAYKQPLVTVPPYIGINLSVDGQAIRKPGVRRPDVAIPVEPYFTPRNSVRQSLSNEKVFETKKSGGSNSVPAAGKSSGEGGKSTGSSSKASSSESGNTKGHSTKSEPVSQDSGHKASVIIVSKSESKRSDYVDSHLPIKNHPQPPLHPKVCTQTPYLAGLTTRRIVSRTSVSNNYTIPPTIMDRQNKATVSVNNVESTDLKTMKSTGVVKETKEKTFAVEGCVDALIDGTWGRTCSECGGGMNLHLDNVNPNCRCRQDSVIVTMAYGRARSARFAAPPFHPSSGYNHTRPPSASFIPQTKGKASSNTGFKNMKMEKVLLKYTDGGIKRPIPLAMQTNQLPKLVRRYIGRRMAPSHDTNMLQSSVYIDTSQIENPLSIVSQSYCR
ncbi:tubulin tyrosine ligase 3-like isoform X3 [Haliotis cracherodii]|uniref:tubulin tyrosine ligase 3-like isoform X3 n=1 Tax=Haliotis cracherodii TaxID=6455 RepID=UPI0039E9A127